MKFDFKDIPEEGLSVSWSHKEHALKDIHTYKVDGFILPLESGFDVSGTVKAEVLMDCSFCTVPLPIPIQEKFHEIFLLGAPPQKNSLEEEFPEDLTADEIYIQGTELNLSHLIFDSITTALPIQPKCLERGAPSHYPKCQADWDYQSYLDQYSKTSTDSPFDALKGLKNLKKN